MTGHEPCTTSSFGCTAALGLSFAARGMMTDGMGRGWGSAFSPCTSLERFRLREDTHSFLVLEVNLLVGARLLSGGVSNV